MADSTDHERIIRTVMHLINTSPPAIDKVLKKSSNLEDNVFNYFVKSE